MQFISYTYPGLESILKQEIEKRKFPILEIGPGFVIFSGDESTLVKANLWLRTANKVYIILKQAKITDFDSLFDLVYSIDWRKYIPKNFKININPHIIKSKLSHIPSVQSISQKAIIKKLIGDKNYDFGTEQIEIRIDIFKDNVKILLDTSGEPLYKRGYKADISKAGLKETLAAGIILLSNCKQGVCYDPFCGSGTLLIEKAMIDLNIAPGSFRNFIFEKFSWINKNLLEKEKRRAGTRRKEKAIKFIGYDIDFQMVEIAKQNVKNVGLEKYIHIEQKDFLQVKIEKSMITNPPYDKRLKLDNIDEIYSKLEKDLESIDCGGVITGYKNISKNFYDKFKVRVLSNGGDKVKFFWK